MPSIDSVLARAAHASPDRIAVREWNTGREFSYSQLDAATSAFARWLGAQSLAPGDAVAIHLPNSADYLIAQFAAYRAGAVAALVNYRLSATEAARQIRLGGARVVVTTAAKAEALRAEPDLGDLIVVLKDGKPPLGHALTDIIAGRSDPLQPVPGREDCDAIARFTSGSTGLPKGVLVTHRSWLVRAAAILAEEIQIIPYSTSLVMGPLSHQAGLFILPTFLRQGTMLVLEQFDVEQVAAAFTTERVSCAQLVPTIMGFVLDDPRSREALRKSGVNRIVYGGSPIRQSVQEDVLQVLPNTEIIQVYGSHEAGSISYLDGASHRDPALRRSAGRPLLAAEVRVTPQSPSDPVGEIEVKTPWMPHARLSEKGREPETSEWSRTGDLGEMKDGFIFLRDRMNDVIISGGFNVYPLEVEAVIDSHPDILSSAIVSAPDDRWGERVIAFVVPRDGRRLDDAALRQYCKDRLANYKVPKEIRTIAQIPTNSSGKPDRRQLSAPMWKDATRRIN